jgi:TldD protein
MVGVPAAAGSHRCGGPIETTECPRMQGPDPRDTFAARFGVDTDLATRALATLMDRNLDDGDLYFEHVEAEGVSLDDGLVKRASRSIGQGVGVRGVAEDRTGYAHTAVIDAESLLEAATAARAIARDPVARARNISLTPSAPPLSLYDVTDNPLSRPLEEKVELLGAIDARARAIDPRIRQVQASIAAELKTVAILTADGRLVLDTRPLSRLSVSVIAVDPARGQRQVGSAGGGGRWDHSAFFDPFAPGAEKRVWEHWVDEAARRALLLLDAKDSPAGTFDVVLGPGWPGILLHEAVGHGLEGDFNRKGTSAFTGMIGREVASKLVTVVDDGTIATRRGSLNIDDEGTPTQRNVLIEDGVLRGYLNDRMNGRLLGTGSTGSGRRESYAHVPMPRMTNTFMLAGESDPSEIVRSVKRGIYAVAFGGGQVDITSGKFTFSGSEAYLIEDGKVTAPLKGATFIGAGPEVLKRVSAVGNDLALDAGVGTCGKDGQSVPVGVGLPTIRVDALTVGGVSLG